MQNYESGHGGDKQLKEDRRRQDRSDEIVSNKNLHDSFNNSNESQDRYAQVQVDKDTKYRHELKQQCDDKEELKHQQHAESLVQRQKREDIGTIMADQDQRYIEHQQEQSEELRKDRISFKKDCGDYRDMQRELINIEEKRIDGQRDEYSNRADAVIAERERKIKVKDDIDEKRAAEMMADEDERHDREHDLDLKHELERLEKNLQEDIKMKDKHDDDQRDLRDCLLSQMEDNKRYVKEETQRDQVFSDEANALMFAGDEIEKERARKKKEVNDQYGVDLRQQIEDNATRRQKEKEEDRH